VKGITFRALYVPLILDGTKTTTIRRPSNRLPGPGEPIRLVCRYDRPPFAFAHVLDVRDVTPAQLTEADAHADGFPHLADLLAAIADHCADGPDAQPAPLLAVPVPLRIIRFQLDPTL
jgi:hypothetical protein